MLLRYRACLWSGLLGCALSMPFVRAADLPPTPSVPAQHDAGPGQTAAASTGNRKGSAMKDSDIPTPTPKDSWGLKPLDEMTAQDKYKGEDGGLYGGGNNQPPAALLKAALAETAQIKPLDAKGAPDPQGKIGFISFGMSNTTQEFQTFLQLAHNDTSLSPQLTIVDGAQGGKEARAWATTPVDQAGSPWQVLDQRLAKANLSAQQVQACWMLLAVAQPSLPMNGAEYPGHTDMFRKFVTECLQRLKQRYPNLRIVFVSSRNYAGYATTPLNPEPFAYEYGFAVRRMILDQAGGNADLNFQAARGPVKAPALIWGPYLWADGMTKRKDGLFYVREDFVDADHTHPSETGRKKVADRLLAFLKTDPASKPWFTRAQP